MCLKMDKYLCLVSILNHKFLLFEKIAFNKFKGNYKYIIIEVTYVLFIFGWFNFTREIYLFIIISMVEFYSILNL